MDAICSVTREKEEKLLLLVQVMVMAILMVMVMVMVMVMAITLSIIIINVVGELGLEQIGRTSSLVDLEERDHSGQLALDGWTGHSVFTFD